ncbi:AtpZ/AtpI family protein [Chloracidobacterium aggregatum]|uniref:AtpZ/AtpI family protein n=1 Tax=Chloracidobacterium sp. N TaxID=2821540 RepID=A0ABX8AZE8_9BACT|nr:AtpZ/AtpI family protein [Chloracidobacterium aggregatum]QUV90525.1 AtpZ/AtpI family protein [Chloracidobacterium sp. A]QUV93737.1 AtpZ/AtpI family protein [Chloracidobacterium sp. N]
MPSPQNSDNDEAVQRARMLTAAGLALGLPMTMLGSFLVGYWLDRQFQTAPLWFFLLGIAGLVSSARLLYRLWEQLR